MLSPSLLRETRELQGAEGSKLIREEAEDIFPLVEK